MTSQAEVIAAVSALVAKEYAGDWQAGFQAFDADGDGKLDRSEVSAVLDKAGVGSWLTRPVIAEAVVSALDADGDGAVSWAEFQSITHVTPPA